MSDSNQPAQRPSYPPQFPPAQQTLLQQPSRKPKSRLIPALITGVACAALFGSCGAAIGAAGAGEAPQTVAGATTTVTAPGGERTVAGPTVSGPTVTVTQAAKPAPTVTVTQKAAAPAAPKGFGPGTYEVGPDIPAGKYKTKGPDDSGLDTCYWSRNKDASGEDIIANSLLKGQGVVQIHNGEYFETVGCQDWVKQ